MSDPQLPYFIQWDDACAAPVDGGARPRSPSTACRSPATPSGCASGSACPADETSSVIDFTFVAPHGTPGLLAVTFDTPSGKVTV